MGIELPYNSAIPLLSIHTEETELKQTRTLMFITALFTVPKTWKQPRYPSSNEWIRSCGTYTQGNIIHP